MKQLKRKMNTKKGKVKIDIVKKKCLKGGIK